MKATSVADEKAKSAISEVTKEHYSLSLFGGWTAAGLSTSILLLDKPLGGLIEEIFRENTQYAQIAKIGLGFVIIFGTALSLWSKHQESQRSRRFSSILTDVGTQQILHSYSYLIFENGPTDATQDFSLASLASAIREYSRIPDRTSCEATAEAIIKKLEARNLIPKTTTVSFSPKYSISKETLESSDWHDFYRFERSDTVHARLKRYVQRKLTKLRSKKKVD
ncbi:hypothetical protein [Rhodopseudomonas sp. RCAM05734]|uniref:hypothetical protein n=1 Tax=Rhodopseudomonas sp. RCAM05734 TaxID=3457549 RepID=UPI004044A78D